MLTIPHCKESLSRAYVTAVVGRGAGENSTTGLMGLDQQEQFEHVITMFWEREKEQLVRIRVPLSPQQYMQACDAHKEGRSIRIYGVPVKEGKFWTLTKPHDFTVLGTSAS